VTLKLRLGCPAEACKDSSHEALVLGILGQFVLNYYVEEGVPNFIKSGTGTRVIRIIFLGINRLQGLHIIEID